MKFIIDFYHNLDTVNLILFWGVIIVVTLLLFFAIIINNKNKKLKELIIAKEIELDDAKNELAIKIEQNNQKENDDKEELKEEPKVVEEPQGIPVVNVEAELPVIEEEEFIAEEHVMPDNNKIFFAPNIEKNGNLTEQVLPQKPNVEKRENLPKETSTEKTIININIPTKPYERNVLREMSLNQTSPIGIVRNDIKKEPTYEKAEELNQILNDNLEESKPKSIYSQDDKSKTTNYYAIKPKGNYLEELSKKMASSTNESDINRTSYELKQEEDAIISYEELMRKKDNIKTIDEEDAVISIQELIEKKQQEEKLYNLTPEAEDSKFINELKNFRSDL